MNSLSELQTLFAENKGQLGEEEQRLFQAILLELAKGDQMNLEAMSKMVRALGERSGLTE